jgi:hypothetical protein
VRLALLALAAVAACGCRTGGIYDELQVEAGIRALHPPPNMNCKDGRPVRLLVGSACNMGICGWTCADDRWAPELKP